MPVTKSAAKRARQTLKRHKRNLSIKQNMKRDIKALLTTIAQNNPKNIAGDIAKAQSSIDKAAKAGIIHKNKAAREKAKLAKLAKAKPAATKTTQTATKKAPGQKPTAKKPAAKKTTKAK